MCKKAALNGQNALSEENTVAVQARLSLQTTRDWADAHAMQIALYNDWSAGREPYSQRVRRWREQAQSESASKSAL